MARFSDLQLGQINASFKPHSWQNFFPSGFSNWHFEHFIFDVPCKKWLRSCFRGRGAAAVVSNLSKWLVLMVNEVTENIYSILVFKD